MSKNNFSKKQKVAVSASAAIAAASSIIAPLAMTSCANTTIKQNDILDKEYGVSKETYEDLKQQFRVAYGQKLEKAGYSAGLSEYQKRMNALEEDIQAFDKVDEDNKPSYTALTSALIDFAREQKQKYPTVTKSANGVTNQDTEVYGIQLVRHTRTKWSDLNDMYAGMADSFKTYMHNNKMPSSTINKIMAESKAKFDTLTKQLKATYGNDALAGLLKAKEKIITLFDDVNDDIALVSASIRLKDFMSEFAFNYKDYNDDGTYYRENRLDVLQNDANFQVGKVLTNELMNRIFTITRNTTGKEVTFDAKTIVPGYTIQPKLTEIYENKYTNTYSISIDFGLVKNANLQKYGNNFEKLNTVTAHNYNLNLNAFTQMDFEAEHSLADTMRLTKATSLQYTVRLTPEEEANRLKEVYFNPKSKQGCISFKWTDNENEQAYEAFFDDARQNTDGTWDGTLQTQSLANAGLMISSKGNNFRSISKTLNNEKEDDLTSQDFEGMFIDNCFISSKVHIVEGKDRRVTHNFKVGYSNSIYNDDAAIYKLNNRFYASECVNFAISDNFYISINNKFNQVSRYVNCYSGELQNYKNQSNDDNYESKLAKLRKDALKSLILRSVTLLANAAALTFTIAKLFTPESGFNAGGPRLMYWLIALVALSTAGFEGYNYYKFEQGYYQKIKTFEIKNDEAQDEIKKSSLMSILKTDLNENFVLYNEDGSYDKTLFAQRKANFEKNSMSEMLNMYRKYSTINSYDQKQLDKNTTHQSAMMKFDNILTTREITKSNFDAFHKKWEIGKGIEWWSSFVISSLICILNICLTFLNYAWGEYFKSYSLEIDQVTPNAQIFENYLASKEGKLSDNQIQQELYDNSIDSDINQRQYFLSFEVFDDTFKDSLSQINNVVSRVNNPNRFIAIGLPEAKSQVQTLIETQIFHYYQQFVLKIRGNRGIGTKKIDEGFKQFREESGLQKVLDSASNPKATDLVKVWNDFYK